MKGIAAVSMHSKLSAIGFWHHINQRPNLCDCFLIRKALIGSANIRPLVPSQRLPVSPAVLLHMVSALPSVGVSSFGKTLFIVVFMLSYFAFLQVGE